VGWFVERCFVVVLAVVVGLRCCWFWLLWFQW